MRSIVNRTHRNRNTTLENNVLCKLEEVILDTKRAKMSELFSARLAISHAFFEKVVVEEGELDLVK
jgi:hypothetical protein